MHHFRVELHAVVVTAVIGNGREGRSLGPGHCPEAFRHGVDAVTVAHPDGVALARFPETVEQRRRRRDLDVGAAEFPGPRGAHPAAEGLHHRLLSVADPEDRHATPEDFRCDGRCRFSGYRVRAARQDDGTGRGIEMIGRAVPGNDLAVDTVLTHASRD